MYVNAFWFGVLMTIVFLIVLSLLGGIVRAMRGDDTEEVTFDIPTEQDLEEIVGKKFVIVERGGHLFAEMEKSDGETE